MAWKQPEQSPGYRDDASTPARLIRKRMKELGITQKFLAEATGMSEAKISRIMRDSTVPGDSFEWTEPDINKISIVLQWGKQGRDKLRYSIYPELACYDAALENREGIVRLNCRLAEHGFPLIETKI